MEKVDVSNINLKMKECENYMPQEYVDILKNNPDLANKLLSDVGLYEDPRIATKGTRLYETLKKRYYLSVKYKINDQVLTSRVAYNKGHDFIRTNNKASISRIKRNEY